MDGDTDPLPQTSVPHTVRQLRGVVFRLLVQIEGVVDRLLRAGERDGRVPLDRYFQERMKIDRFRTLSVLVHVKVQPGAVVTQKVNVSLVEQFDGEIVLHLFKCSPNVMNILFCATRMDPEIQVIETAQHRFLVTGLRYRLGRSTYGRALSPQSGAE
ncbi:hypothetical protein STPH2_7252 [Streptomyces sp. KO7888]|nr:hypothetical protein [Streptomyces sp. KO7888]